MWVDKINSKDHDHGINSAWLEELLSSLPYPEDTNFIVDPELIKNMEPTGDKTK